MNDREATRNGDNIAFLQQGSAMANVALTADATKDCLREILVPMDFTPCSFKALRTAVPYAQQFHAKITLLHVIDIALDYLDTARADVTTLERDLRQETSVRFGEAIGKFASSGVRFDMLVTEGLPAEQILEVARERRIDLIVLGKHPTPRRWSLFHRQTVKEVMEEAPCEVIIVIDHESGKLSEHHHMLHS